MNFREFFTTHSWWGKFLGALFGYLSAGPAGALLGLLVGNFFDRGLANHFANPHWFYYREKRKHVQKIFFEATFSIMGHLAKADGRVTEQELNVARLLMNEMRLTNQQKTLAKQLFNQGKQAEFNLNQILNELYLSSRDNRDLLKLFIDIQYRAAKTDGLSTKKIRILDNIFSHLGFAPFHQQYRFYEDFGSYDYQEQPSDNAHTKSSSSESSYSHYRHQPAKTNLDHAYALLQVPSDANKPQVKQAYRRLLSRNHPDKLIAQGLPPDKIKIANEKTQKIVKAYELICSSRGW